MAGFLNSGDDLNPSSMLRNYLTLGLRNLIRHANFSILNIAGLSIGMAACFILIQFARYEEQYDDFHAQSNDIYRLSLGLTADEHAHTEVPKNFSALGPALKNDFPEVKDYVRLFPIDGSIAMKIGDVAFNEKNVLFADASIFNVFTFPIIQGDANTALKAPYSVVLTQSTARRYFGDQNPLGKQISMREGNINVALSVTGVIHDVPSNSHIGFDLLVSHATLSATWGERADRSWDEALFYTYVLLQPKADHMAWTKKLTPELLKGYAHWRASAKLEFIVQPLRDIHLHSHMVQEAKVNGDARQVTLLWIIAVMIVLLSWINYINISTSRYLERAKEVGVRKVIGANKTQLMLQFVAESLLMTGISMFIACAMIQLFVPMIADFTGKTIPIWGTPSVLLCVLLLFLGGSLLAAVFPSFILSSLNAANVLKGRLRSSSTGLAFRKSLIVFQFISSALIIGGTFVVYLQLKYMRTADIGADIAATLILPTPDITDSTYASRARYFKSQLMKHGDIEWAVTSSSIPGKQDNIVSGGLSRIEKADEQGVGHYHFGIDRAFIDAYNIKLIAGRNFSATGDNESVILNETAIRTIGFANAEEAIGQRIATNWSSGLKIIGIVADFQGNPFDYFFSRQLFRRTVSG